MAAELYGRVQRCVSCGCCEGYCAIIGSHGTECTGDGGGLLWATDDGKAGCEQCGMVVERPDGWDGLCGPCDPPHFPKDCQGCGKPVTGPSGEATCYNFADGADFFCRECGDHECEGPCHP